MGLFSELSLELIVAAACSTVVFTWSDFPLFEKMREYHYFFECPLCVGFWAGAAFSLGVDFHANVVLLFSRAVVTSFVAFFLHKYVDELA